MGQAYTPGLKVTQRLHHRCKRLLPIKGEVLVKVGDQVDAEQVVAQTFMPGTITPVNMANLLSMPPGDVMEAMLKQEGDEVEVGDLLAQTKGIFGFMKTSVPSKHAGTIETISEITGQLILRGEPIPVQVRAYLEGVVTEVIPDEGVVIDAEVSFIQGIFGIGGEAYGPIKVVVDRHDVELTADLIKPEHKGCIVVGGARVWHDAIERAVEVGCAAVVAGGIDDQDLKLILGYDLGVAVTGSERIGTTVLITEGFGDIAMADRTFGLIKSREGAKAAVNGATQIRAGVMRPEIVIPLVGEPLEDDPDNPEVGQLKLGRIVRVIRDPHFGVLGTVSGLPHEPAVLGSGSKARVLEVKLDSGESVTVPRANVELIEA